jgi:hypothetical protein
MCNPIRTLCITRHDNVFSSGLFLFLFLFFVVFFVAGANNKILLTNLLYYDYKCLCFINLLAGYYGIYGALIQGSMGIKWSIMKKLAPNFNTLTWVLFLSFLTKIVIFKKKQITGDYTKFVMSEIDWISIRHMDHFIPILPCINAP